MNDEEIVVDIIIDSPKITVGFASDIGLRRQVNEDSYAVFMPFPGEPNLSGLDAMLCVADGMGGEAAGEVASSYATSRVREWFSTGAYLRWNEATPEAEDPLEVALQSTVLKINREIYGMSRRKPELKGMGSTIVIAAIKQDQIYLANLGDSRCYLIRDNAISRLTVDHSWVGRQVQVGMLTEEEARNHPQRNIITKSLGMEEDTFPDVSKLQIMAGDQFLLCSDGLCGRIPDSVILETVLNAGNPQNACTQLVEVANQLDGSDNITVVLAKIGPRDEPKTSPDAQGNILLRQKSRLPLVATAIIFAGLGYFLNTASSYLFSSTSNVSDKVPNPHVTSLPVLTQAMSAFEQRDYQAAHDLFEQVIAVYHSDPVYIEALTHRNKTIELLAASEFTATPLPTTFPSPTPRISFGSGNGTPTQAPIAPILSPPNDRG